MNFEEFGLKKRLLEGVTREGFTEPSLVQEKAIPLIMEGKNVVIQAHTGTGKTAAFGLPILHMLENNNSAQAVIIVPTRELAIQVSDELFRFGKYVNVNTATVYGGSSYVRQLKHIERSALIIATPGRLLDLLKSNRIDIQPDFLVLDEFDEMLDMGFYEDVKEILSYFSDVRQKLMFSATMSNDIKMLIGTIAADAEIVITNTGPATNVDIEQFYYIVDEHERDEALMRLFDYSNPHKSIVFCRTKKEVDRLSEFLTAQGYMSVALHGDLDQRKREEVIKKFRKSETECLVATDVAARGLDIKDISHVFNYHISFDGDSYVHRIGRTGRAGKKGTAISIISPSEYKGLLRIEKTIGKKIENRLVPTLSDVQGTKVPKIIESIQKQDIHSASHDVVEQLKESMDLSTIAYKLFSMLYDKKESGSSGKGVIGKRLEDIQHLIDREGKERRKRPFGGRGGRGGGGRGGNGGGGRGNGGGGGYHKS